MTHNCYMTAPLSHHDLHRLQEAQKELSAHIKARKRVLRPSTPRRIIGLAFSIPAVIAGLVLFFLSFQVNHPIGLSFMIGPVLMAGGGIWIYSDWFE